jgi:hypothetical protein
MDNKGYRANEATLLKDFIATAKRSKYWIYHPGGKKWYTPEEFQEGVEQHKIDLIDGWLEKFKIMNPIKGLEAAEILAQQLNDKKIAFQKRVFDYYLNNPQ